MAPEPQVLSATCPARRHRSTSEDLPYTAATFEFNFEAFQHRSQPVSLAITYTVHDSFIVEIKVILSVSHPTVRRSDGLYTFSFKWR